MYSKYLEWIDTLFLHLSGKYISNLKEQDKVEVKLIKIDEEKRRLILEFNNDNVTAESDEENIKEEKEGKSDKKEKVNKEEIIEVKS